MIVDQVVNNVELGLFHARMVSLLRATFPQVSMDSVLRQELTNGFQSVYFPPTANTVGVYYGGDNTRKIMYLDGVSTLSQAEGLIGGYSAAFGLQVITTLNTWIRDNLDSYLAMMTGNHLQTPEYLELVGYSGGGAIAEGMAWRLRQQQTTLKIKVVTFGAPRPGAASVRDGLSRMPIARYMTPADPIPLIPPRLQDAPQLAPLIPVSVFLSWSNMVHPQGGIEVDVDGNTSDAVLPSQASMTAGTSLAAWMLGADQGVVSAHSMQTYIAHLLASNQRFDRPKEKKRDVAPQEVEAVERRQEVNRARERVATVVRDSQRNQANTIVNNPPFVLFRPLRMGRVWAVAFGDKIVCQGVREDTCRHLCRAGNDFLRSLPKQGLVDPLTLQSQFEQFLLFATSPESEWEPKLATNLDLS